MAAKDLTFETSGGATGTAQAVAIVNADAQPIPVNLVGASGGVTINVDEADLSVLGAQADAAATTDTGTFSIAALMKRGLQRWTTLLARIPVLGTALTAAAMPVTLASDDAQIGTKVTAVTALGTGGTGIIGWLSSIWNATQNPAVVTGNITAATAAPSTIAALVASSYQVIAGGVVDAVTARVNSITGGAATGTIAFYASDDDVNLYPISGLPVGGGIGSGALVSSATATGAWSLKGASARKVYAIATAIGAGATVNVSLSATPNTSRITVLLRGSLGGAITGAAGSPTSEAVTMQAPAASNSTTTAYAASRQVKASAGTLYKLSGFNSKTSAQWVQIHDSAGVPAEGAAPGPILYVGALANFSFDFDPRGRTFASGIYVCNSSTGPTKTLGSADCWFDAQYL